MRRRTKQMALASIAAILLFAAFLGLQLHFDNFHEVIPNELYRSAQLDAEDIKHHVEKKAIRSILNLRGAHQGQGARALPLTREDPYARAPPVARRTRRACATRARRRVPALPRNTAHGSD